jgi:acetyl esterase
MRPFPRFANMGEAMQLDPAVQTLFEQMPLLARYPLWEKSPEEARAEVRAMYEIYDAKVVPIGKTENVEATGPAGALPLRVYTPVAPGSGALPAIVYFHGGGFVVGDLDCYDTLCRILANESGCRVVAVDYRLAPEHPFPAAVDDCFAALKWVEDKASVLCIDPNRMVVAGDSAGANLAAVTCLLARDNKDNPKIVFQLLIYPPTQMGGVSETRPHASGYLLDQRSIDWFQSHYVPKDADRADPRLSPLAATDAGRLPPAYIVTAGFDPLREEGLAYAEKLKRADVPVTLVDYPSMIHGFFSMSAFIPLASEAIAAAAQAVKHAVDPATVAAS